MNRLPALTGSEYALIVNALSTAADTFSSLAAQMDSVNNPAMAEQFRRQRSETRALLDKLTRETEDR